MTEIEKIFYERLALQEEYGGNDKPVNRIQPLVSVVTTTYQHAPYIRQCLDSILMQETDFPYEIIIGEDGSTDGTREICIQYAEKYPDKIRLFLRDRAISHYVDSNANHIRFNGYFCRAEARGEYVAICEGDDYWIDKYKLSIQVQYLNKNKDATGVCTEFSEIDEHNLVLHHKNPKNNIELVKLSDIIISDCIGTLTVMYKKMHTPLLLPEPLFYLWDADWSLWTMLLMKGPIIKINKETSVYRNHRNGASKVVSLERIEHDALKYYKYIENKIGEKYKNAINTGIAYVYLKIGNRYYEKKIFTKAIRCLIQSMLHKISSKTYKSQMTLMVRIIFLPLSNAIYFHRLKCYIRKFIKSRYAT